MREAYTQVSNSWVGSDSLESLEDTLVGLSWVYFGMDDTVSSTRRCLWVPLCASTLNRPTDHCVAIDLRRITP